jgi:hypothetical protein
MVQGRARTPQGSTTAHLVELLMPMATTALMGTRGAKPIAVLPGRYAAVAARYLHAWSTGAKWWKRLSYGKKSVPPTVQGRIHFMGRELLSHRRKLEVAATFQLSAALPSVSLAQAFPSKAITLIGPYAAGGTVDIIARRSEPLRKTLGQPIIVESSQVLRFDRHALCRSRARGWIHVARTDQRDSHHASHQQSAGVAPLGLRTSWDDRFPHPWFSSRIPLPVKSVRELIDFAKANPGKIDFGSSGPDSTGASPPEVHARSRHHHDSRSYKGMGAIVQSAHDRRGEVDAVVTTPQASQLVRTEAEHAGSRGARAFAAVTWRGAGAARSEVRGRAVVRTVRSSRDPHEVITKLHDALGEAVARPESRPLSS